MAMTTPTTMTTTMTMTMTPSMTIIRIRSGKSKVLSVFLACSMHEIAKWGALQDARRRQCDDDDLHSEGKIQGFIDVFGLHRVVPHWSMLSNIPTES